MGGVICSADSPLFLWFLHSKLHSLGMSQEEINQRVKETAHTEAEDIYGTLYGTLGEPDSEEDE